MEGNTTFISIIVPVYKVEKYIRECLDSLLKQTYKNIEIILVDDGSPDKCPQICNEYAARDDRVTVIHKENGGLVSAWVCGLDKSANSADYVAFVDSDDFVSERYIETMVKEHERTKADIVTVLMQKICSEGNKLISSEVKKPWDKHMVPEGFYTRSRIEKEIFPVLLNAGDFQLRGIPISRWGKLIRKDLIYPNLKYCSPTTTYSEDLNIMFPVFLDMQSISIMNSEEAVYYYRMNPVSMLHAYDRNMLNSINHVFSTLLTVCRDKDNEQFTSQVYADYLAASVQYYKNELKNPDRYFNVKENIKKYSRNEMLRTAIANTDWKHYRKLNVLIIFVMKNFNWFHANITTRILRLLMKFRLN